MEQTIKLVGNVLANISRLGWKKLLKVVNPNIQDLTEEDVFESVAPFLFGKVFEEKMKSRTKSLEILLAAKDTQRKKKFFQLGLSTAPPPPKRQ